MFNNGRMTLLSSLAALFSGRPAATPATTPTDLELRVVKLDPPDGSTLGASEDVTVTVEWRYSTPASHIPIWVKPESPDAVAGSYGADGGEARPGQGSLERTISMHEAGHVDGLLLVAKDDNSREIYRRVVPVNYTFVASAEHDEKMRDGLGSRILSVTFDPPSPARLKPGTCVTVHIAYDARSEHGLRPLAIPLTDAAMTYNGAVTTVEGEGEMDQDFTVGEPGTVKQVRVTLWNEVGGVVAEKIVDVDLHYDN